MESCFHSKTHSKTILVDGTIAIFIQVDDERNKYLSSGLVDLNRDILMKLSE
jgi:hypothetical protein